MMAPQIAGVVLAGGLSRRMGGGDKTLLGDRRQADSGPRGGTVCMPQVGPLVLNINGDPERFADYGLPVMADPVEGFAGPLAGVLAGLEWTHANHPGIDWVVSAASDSPFLPENLVARLVEALTENCRRHGLRRVGRAQPSGVRTVAGAAAQ